MENKYAKYALIGGALLLAVAFSFDADEAVASEPVPKVSPYPEVDKRIADLDIPESILEKYGPHLSVEDMVKLEQELRNHKEWVDNVVDEYKWVMTTDPSAEEYYKKLVEAQGELQKTLNDLKAHSADLKEIADIQDKLTQDTQVHQTGNPHMDEQRKQILLDQQSAARKSIDRLLEGLNIDHLRDVKGNLAEVYTAAHQISLVGTHGNVWVDGAPKSIAEIFGFDFTQENERNIPRRPARAMYEFSRDMREYAGWDPLFTEGHTGDPNNPTSYKGHISLEHKTGEAADIIPRSGSLTDEGAYQLFMGSKGNEYYRIRFEPGSGADAGRLIDEFSQRAYKDKHFESVSEAKSWFQERISHATPKFNENGVQVKGTTGRHFHVVGLGGLGEPIDPNGPTKVIASR